MDDVNIKITIVKKENLYFLDVLTKDSNMLLISIELDLPKELITLIDDLEVKDLNLLAKKPMVLITDSKSKEEDDGKIEEP